MRQGLNRDPEAIRKAADRAQMTSIEHKRASGEALLPEEEAFLQNIEAQKRDASAELIAYVKRYPTLAVFRAAVRNAADSFREVADTELPGNAELAARDEGLLNGLSDEVLHSGIVLAVMEAHGSNTEQALAGADVAYYALQEKIRATEPSAT